MKILLVQPHYIQGNILNLTGKEIPLAFCYIAAYLKREGFDQVRILDLALYGDISPHLEQELERFKPDLVGITSYTHNIGLAGRIAQIVKMFRPQAVTVIGGMHASALPERTLREFRHFDCLAMGEGEITMKDIAQALSEGRSLEGMAGVVTRKGEDFVFGPKRPFIAPLDILPFPDRSLVPIKCYVPDPGNYFQLPSTGILFSRGCPFCCTYCSKAVFQNAIRYRSVDNFLDEVEECIERLGIRDFRLEDEGPTTNPKKMRELCIGILDRKVRITWNCFSRVDSVDQELLSLMKRAGCYHVIYGVESAIPQTLERIGKKIDLAKAEQAVRLTKAQGSECKVNFILGFPWETMDEMRYTVRYARRLAPDLVSFNIFKPLPGSVLFDEMDKAGKIKHTRWEDYFVISEKQLFDAAYSEEEMRKLIRNAFLGFYLRPRFIAQRLVRLLSHPTREAATIGRGLRILGRGIFTALLNLFRRPRREESA